MTRQRVPNAELYRDTARQNLLTNGGFEIWQRGNGPFTAAGAACTDRWFIELAGTDTHSVSRDTTNVDSANGSRTAAACTVTKGTGGADLTKFTQTLKATEYDLINRTLSASVRVRTATANAVRLGLFDGSAFSFSPYHSGGGTWQTLTVSVTMTAGATLTQIAVVFNLSCTAYIDNAMLVVGNVAADYIPMHPADDLARCLRYYEVLGKDGPYYPMLSGYQVATNGVWLGVPFKAAKPVVPTVTKNGTWAVSNSGQPALGGANTDGAYMVITPTATGMGAAYPNGAGQTLTVEANP